jgi:Ca-activated chloride channel homolog
MFNSHTYQNSNSAGAAFMEIVQQRDEETAPDLQPRFMPLRGTRLTGSVSGSVARLQITHRFGHEEDSERPVLEAVYRFPLPGDAAVTGVRVMFGEVEIRAELADRTKAEKDYDHARATGRQAILLTRESPDVFSLHVSGIEPGQDVVIVTDYVQSLYPQSRGFTMRVPLTPAPRFTSFKGHGGRHEHGQPLEPTRDPSHRFSLDLHVAGDTSVASSTHRIATDIDAEGVRVSLADGEVVPDRDLVLTLESATALETPSLQIFHHEDDDHDYFLALVTPPEQTEAAMLKPREIILLVDRSGSMSGPKWEAADWAVRRFLSSLRPDDHFSIGLFHTHTRWFSRVSVPATEENVNAAHSFIDANHDSGGTNLELALEESITCGRAGGDISRHIVIITDAQVTNARANLALARAESQRSNRRRISMLCIDAAPNSFLVHEMVAFGGGQASFLTSDPDEGDIATALDELMTFWDRPVATGLTLTINRPDLWVMGRPVDEDFEDQTGLARVDLGDLPFGRPIWIVGRAGKAEVPLSLSLADSSGTITTDDRHVNRAGGDVKAVFGARRLTALEFQLDPAAAMHRWHREPRTASDNLRDQLVTESLAYGLACSETSFIAVREEAGKLVQRGSIIPNALPAGWSDEFLAYEAMPARASVLRERRVYSEKLDSASPAVPWDSGDGMAYARMDSGPKFDRTRGGTITLFSGIPNVSEDELILYEIERFGDRGRLTALFASLDDDDGMFDGELALYTGRDPEPRARVRLRDILKQGGRRPLNISIRSNHPIRLVLRDIVRGESAPKMIIELTWA